jgi:hypothetical protein
VRVPTVDHLDKNHRHDLKNNSKDSSNQENFIKTF